jgi:hypothetical protein
MKIVRLYTGPDNESHFEDIEIKFDAVGNSELSAPQAATSIIFRRTPADQFIDWHNAPRRQYVITLSGEVEIEIGDGTVRRFGPGDILLAEDLTGRGHITRGVGSEPRFSIFVPLAD